MAIWDFRTYREYLIDQLGAEGSRTGKRKRLAEAIRVHTTFVSQIMKGRAELSLEQAEAVNEFFAHTEDEAEFFVLLILRDRAGTKPLRARFERKIEVMREERVNIKKRLQPEGEISLAEREKFYSSYIYGAIHVLSAIAGYQSVAALTAALKFPRAHIQDAVEFMLKLGILIEEKGRLGPGPRHVHLGNDSELILKHHSNWRLHTLANLQFLNSDDLHYSACVSLSREDAYRVKESILKNLKHNVDLISASKEEVAYVMDFDFYKLVD